MKPVCIWKLLLVGIFSLSLAACNSDSSTSPNNAAVAATAAESFSITVRGADGALLSGVQLTLGANTATTGDNGVAALSLPAVGGNQVLRVSKSGFITQVLPQDFLTEAAGRDVGVRLLPVKQIIQIAQAEQAQVLLGSSLSASVTLPANALVNPVLGTLATGPITLQLTPWNITNQDLLAMPGNGQAIDAQNNRVTLISAGMLTVDFFDAAGNKLQLATGKTADIQMDLPIASINGQTLNVGSIIPLWNFDEAQGLWIEEGTGVVVASASSPVGLAVKATVSHFSTWNWDFKFDNPGSVVVSCVNADNTPTACDVVATVTLPDGSQFVKSTTLGTTPTTVINMPNTGTILWRASTATGLQGSITSGTSGTVVIPLNPPTTSNFVQCLLPVGTPVNCTVTLTGSDANGGGIVSQEFVVPASGSTIQTGLLPTAPLNWQGVATRRNPNGSVTRNVGSVSSGPNGAVAIVLGPDDITPPRVISLQCDTVANVSFESIQTAPLDFCDVTVIIYDNATEQTLYEVSQRIRTGVPVNLDIPPDTFVEIQAQGRLRVGQDDIDVFGSEFFMNDELNNGQSLILRLMGGGDILA